MLELMSRMIRRVFEDKKGTAGSNYDSIQLKRRVKGVDEEIILQQENNQWLLTKYVFIATVEMTTQGVVAGWGCVAKSDINKEPYCSLFPKMHVFVHQSSIMMILMVMMKIVMQTTMRTSMIQRQSIHRRTSQSIS